MNLLLILNQGICELSLSLREEKFTELFSGARTGGI